MLLALTKENVIDFGKYNMKNIDIILWTSCNLNCVFCSPDLLKNKKNLDSEKYFSKIQFYYQQWFRKITFSWWEPLLYAKELLAFIAYAKKIWFEKIKIQTNLTFLTKPYFSLLLRYWVSQIGFTYLGFDEVSFEKITGNKKNFWKFLEGKKLLFSQNASLEIVADIVLNDEILPHLGLIFEELRVWGVIQVFIKYPFNTPWKTLPNKIWEYSQVLNHTLDTLKIEYSLLYIPTCYVPQLSEKIYSLEDDFIDDEDYFFSLKEITERNFVKSQECVHCRMKESCFWIHKGYTVSVSPIL